MSTGAGPSVTFRWGAVTDKGRVRDGNEDHMSAADGLFVVADGMGGHLGGETASHVAVETLREGFAPGSSGPSPQAGAARGDTASLVRAVEEANDEILRQSMTDAELEGMGTTLCALAKVSSAAGERLAAVNVGDSRLYLLRGGELRQVTDDHSLVATLERQGRITPAEAAVHPQRNILTRALGIDEQVMVDSWELEAVPGDRYLLCTDGLFNEVDDPRIAATLRRLADAEEAARELVRLANENGGRDNVTAVVVDVAGETEPADAERGVADRGADRPEAPPLPPVPRARRFTWRVALFLVVLAAIVGAAVGIIAYGTANEEPPPPTTTTTSSSTTTTAPATTTTLTAFPLQGPEPGPAPTP